MKTFRQFIEQVAPKLPVSDYTPKGAKQIMADPDYPGERAVLPQNHSLQTTGVVKDYEENPQKLNTAPNDVPSMYQKGNDTKYDPDVHRVMQHKMPESEHRKDIDYKMYFAPSDIDPDERQLIMAKRKTNLSSRIA